MLHLFKTLVRENVEYCSPLWNPALLGDVQLIEDVQRHFTSKISGCKDIDYHSRLKYLKLQSLQRRRERYSIIQVWKILHNIAPNDLNLEFSAPKRNGIKIKLPAISPSASQSAQTLYDRSFSINSSKLWNILPKEVNEAVKLEAFKTKLGSFLESFSDSPLTTGYVTLNSNSLLEWHASRLGGSQMVQRP